MEKDKKIKDNKNDIKFEIMYFRYKDHPTEWTFYMLTRELCKINEFWFAAKLAFSNELKELENTNGAIVVLSDDSDVHGDILVSQDGTMSYHVFTDVEKVLLFRDNFYKDKGVLSIGKTSMEDIMDVICEQNINNLIINFTHATQLTLNENDIITIKKVMQDVKKEHDEENDTYYKKGRNYSDEADRLYFGLGVQKNKVLALELYTKASQLLQLGAEQGNAKAQYDLGLLIRNGKGIEQDFEKAAYWLRRSATNCDTRDKKKIEEMISEFKFYERRPK